MKKKNEVSMNQFGFIISTTIAAADTTTTTTIIIINTQPAVPDTKFTDAFR
jgi:hypothetical protein